MVFHKMGCSQRISIANRIEQSVTRINEAHRIIVKQVVYDEFMKEIRTVRHSFNTTAMANYRVQLAVTPSITIIIIIIIILFSKKLTNKYTRNLRIFNYRVGTIVDRKKVLKQAGVMHNIKSQ